MTLKINNIEYYSLDELEPIEAVTRQTLVKRCNDPNDKNYYEGAIKHKANNVEAWYVPVSTIRKPVAFQEVLEINRNIPVGDLVKAFGLVMEKILDTKLDEKLDEKLTPIQQDLESLRSEIIELKNQSLTEEKYNELTARLNKQIDSTDVNYLKEIIKEAVKEGVKKDTLWERIKKKYGKEEEPDSKNN